MGLYYKGINENGINVLSKSRYLQEAERISHDPKKYILQNVDDGGRAEIAGHENLPCGFKGRRVEKRLCRCLVNYGKGFECKDCCMKTSHNLAKKVVSKNGEQFKMTDFEIAVSNGDAPIGAIDLVFSFDNEKYIAEFKPYWNNETLLRMIAEIETYAYVANKQGHYKDSKKAIVFMDNSEQYRQYFRDSGYAFKANQAIFEILRELRISVFCLYNNKKDNVYILEKVG